MAMRFQKLKEESEISEASDAKEVASVAPKLQQGAPPGTDRPPSPSAAAVLAPPQPKPVNIIPGKYVFEVHCIEGRDLWPRDINGMSDPYVEVTIFDTTKKTEKKSRTLNALWDSHLSFEIDVLDRMQLEQGRITFLVKDYDLLTRDDPIGSTHIDLIDIVDSENHSIYKQWFPVLDYPPRPMGVQGYILVSVFILGPGIDHVIPAEQPYVDPMLHVDTVDANAAAKLKDGQKKGKLEPKDKKGDAAKSPSRRASLSEMIKGARPEQKVAPTGEKMAQRRSSSADSRRPSVDVQKSESMKGIDRPPTVRPKDKRELQELKNEEKAGADTRGRGGPRANLINMYVSRPPKFDISMKEVYVEVIAAQGLPRMDRFAMKGNAATDAFVRVELGGYKLQTDVITSYNPEWNAQVTMPFQVCREREPEELPPPKKPPPTDRMGKIRCQSLTNVKPSHRLRISVWDKDPLSSEAIAFLRPVDLDEDCLDSMFHHNARWFYLYGAPPTQDNSEAAAMNKGYLPGSAYRGRIKLRIQLRNPTSVAEHDMAMPQFKHIEKELEHVMESFKTTLVKPVVVKTLHGWIWDGCFLEGSKSMRLEIGFGQYQVLVKPKAAQQVEGLPGQFRWYKEFMIEFSPENEDDDVLPDLIVAVSPGTSKNRIGYLRFPGADLVPYQQQDVTYVSGKDRYLRRTLEIPKPFESGWQPLIPDVASGWEEPNRTPGFLYCRFTLTDGRRSPDAEFNKLPIQIAALRSKDQQREEDIIWAAMPPAPPGPPPPKGEKPRPIGLHGVIGFLSNYVRYNLRIGVYMGRNLSGDDPGTADAVCSIEVMGKTLKTEVQKESLNPVWDMYFNTINDIKLLDGDAQSKIIWPMMCIKVYDRDPSHFVGFHYLPLSDVPVLADGSKEPELRLVDTNMGSNAKWKVLPMTDEEKRNGSPLWPCFCLGLYAQLPGKLLGRVPGSVFVYMYLLPNNQKDASDWTRRVQALAPTGDRPSDFKLDEPSLLEGDEETESSSSSSEEDRHLSTAFPSKKLDTKLELSRKSSAMPPAQKPKEEAAHMFLRLTKMMPLLGKMKTLAIDLLGLRLLPGSSYVADTLSKGVYVVEFQFVGFSASTKLSWPTESFIKETEKRNEERKRLEALEAEDSGGFEAFKKKLSVLPNLATDSMDAPNFKEIKLLPFLYLEAFKPYAPVLTVRIYKTSSGAGINMPTLIGIAGFEIPPQCIEQADAMAEHDNQADQHAEASVHQGSAFLDPEPEKKKGGLFTSKFLKGGDKGSTAPASSSTSRSSQVNHLVNNLSTWVQDRVPLRGEPGGVSWSKFARLPPEKQPEPQAPLDAIPEEPRETGSALPRTPSQAVSPSLDVASRSSIPGRSSPLPRRMSLSPSMYGTSGVDLDDMALSPAQRTRTKRATSVLAEDFELEGYEALKDAKEFIEVSGKREETDDIPFNSEDVLRGTKTGATQTAMLGAMKVPLVFKRSKETDANYLVGKIRSCVTVLPSIKPSYYEDALKDDKVKSAFASWEPNRVVVRVYILRAINLPGMDVNGKCDPYLVFLLGNNVDNRKEQKKTADRYPVFNEVFTKTIELPGSAFLTVQLKDYDVIGADEMIGETLIDIESRWYSRKWHQLMWKNIADENARTEWRTLRNPKHPATPAGKIQMRIELFDLEYASHVPEKPLITARLPFEIRLCVWDARNLMHMDPIRGCNDLFVVAILDGMTLKEENQESDTHIGAREGKGSINWRYVFKIELPCDQVVVKLQAYDRDILKVDSIGEAVLDITEMCRKSFEARTSGSKRLSDGPVSIRTLYVPLYHPEPGRGEFPKKKKTLKEFFACSRNKKTKEPTIKGEIKVDMMILPMDLAERLPAGKGREAPNRNPMLPEPDRIKLKWNRPDLIMMEMLGPELFRKVCIFCCIGTCVIGAALIGIWIFSDTISTMIANLLS